MTKNEAFRNSVAALAADLLLDAGATVTLRNQFGSIVAVFTIPAGKVGSASGGSVSVTDTPYSATVVGSNPPAAMIATVESAGGTYVASNLVVGQTGSGAPVEVSVLALSVGESVDLTGLTITEAEETA